MAKLKGFDALGNLFGRKPSENSSQQKNSPPRNFQQKDFQPRNFSNAATAPYNFVSLPEKVLPAPLDNPANFAEYMSSQKLFSGEISLDIETLTPLFIGGNGAKSFAPADKPIIPGSSLRGMFKNIFKVVTCGTFRGRSKTHKKGEDFNDEHIYFRCLMASRNSPDWMNELNKLYNDRMKGSRRGGDGKLRPIKNARPGFLIRRSDNKFFIAPSIYRTDRKDDRILILEYERKFNVTVPERNSSCVEWRGGTAYIITGSQRHDKLCDKRTYEKLSNEDKKRKGKQFIRFTKIDYVDWSRDHWVELPDEVQTSYEHDRNRRGVNLFTDKGILERREIERLTGKNLPDIKTLIPCHYLEEDRQVTAFGHGQCFRIPYKNRIGDTVKISGNDALDFTDLIFGKEKFWASRVYFEDATPYEKISELAQTTTHPLMNPNPTSYQFYLKQDGKNLNHWDSFDAQIRGYKFYWHRAEPDWRASQSELELDKGKAPDKRLTREMTPLKSGIKFASKIRFKNLSAIELGALLMMFDLNGLQTAAYKIGQGRPFGFGSIKITPKLFIESETAYSELFGADGWKNPYREENPADYLNAFKNYLAGKNMSGIWQKVMAELKKILDWSQTSRPDWDEKIKNMSGDVSNSVDQRFKTRAPLPTIFEVVKK